jgi:hypothetical protein
MPDANAASLDAWPYPPHRLARFAQALANEGLAAALAVLNEGVPHRFTALTRIDREWLRPIELFDKAGQPPEGFVTGVKLPDSFCRHTMEQGSFSTDDSRTDARLEHSPYQGVVISYLSVAVRDAAGIARGTLCHFDLVTHTCPEEELGLLHRAAALLAASGHAQLRD